MKRKGLWLNRLVIPALAAGLFALSIFHLTQNLRADERDAAFNTMWENATDRAAHIRSAFIEPFTLLETAALSVPTADFAAGAPEQIAQSMAAFSGTGAIETIFYADPSGVAYAAGQAPFDCGGEAFYLAAMRGERAAGRLLGDDGRFAFAFPVYVGQAVAGAAIGAVSAEALSPLLSSALFDGAARFMITDAGGALLLSCGDAAVYGGDFLAMFDAGSMDAAAITAIRRQFLEGKSGTFEASRDGERLYGVYTRLGAFGWYVVETVPASAVNDEHAFIRNNILTFGAELVLIAGFVASLLVLSEKRRTALVQSDRERLQQSEESYRLLNQLSEGVMFEGSHRDGTLRFNRSYADLFGREPFITSVADLGKENPYVYERDLPAYRRMASDLLTHAHTSSAEFRLYDKANEPRWFRAEYLTALDSSHRPGRFVGKLTDIDTEKRTMQRLAADAERDPLTKLLNRTSMEQRVDDYLETDGRTGLHAFLMIDLDDFKQVNDTYGHVAGDQMLSEVADRLRTLFRTSDFVCRMGGDEFSIFLCNINTVERISIKAQGVIDAVLQLGRRYDTHPRVSVSVGVAVPGKDGNDYKTLYQNADAALYRAKHSGKSTYVFFSE